MELTLRFAHGITGTTYGPGRIRVPENIARTLQEQETRAAEVEARLRAHGAGVIGLGNRLIPVRPEIFDERLGMAEPAIYIN